MTGADALWGPDTLLLAADPGGLDQPRPLSASEGGVNTKYQNRISNANYYQRLAVQVGDSTSIYHSVNLYLSQL